MRGSGSESTRLARAGHAVGRTDTYMQGAVFEGSQHPRDGYVGEEQSAALCTLKRNAEAVRYVF